MAEGWLASPDRTTLPDYKTAYERLGCRSEEHPRRYQKPDKP
jgi:hypothetical protein